LLAAAAAAAAAARNADAQAAPTAPKFEIGMDASLAYQLSDPNSFVASIPVSRVRAGVFMTPLISLEGSLGLVYIHADGRNFSNINGGAGLLFHLSSAGPVQPYIRPLFEWDANLGSGGSTGQYGGGLGIGTKLRIGARVAARIEGAFVSLGGESSLVAYTGLSWFVK
jgi:hypothetical protein